MFLDYIYLIELFFAWLKDAAGAALKRRLQLSTRTALTALKMAAPGGLGSVTLVRSKLLYSVVV